MRRVTGENLPLMKVMMNGDSITYYANHAQHVVVYQLQPSEVLSIESENILAFTPDCKYDVRFIGLTHLHTDRNRPKRLCRHPDRRKSHCAEQYPDRLYACR